MNKNTNNMLILGVIILVAGIFLLSYSISTYKETKSLAAKIDFEEVDNNSQMSSSDKYFKYLSYADYLNQALSKNKNLPVKNAVCAYLDYAQHNAVALYRLTYNGLQTEETRKSVAAGNVRTLYNMLANYKTCKQTETYKSELKNILDDIEKSDNLYAQREQRMESFMNGYDKTQSTAPEVSADIESQYNQAGIAEDTAPPEGNITSPAQQPPAIPQQQPVVNPTNYAQSNQ